MALSENMYLAMHPRCKNADAAAICIDCYIVTPDGGKRVGNSPQKLVALDY
jgi:hypothetical protein